MVSSPLSVFWLFAEVSRALEGPTLKLRHERQAWQWQTWRRRPRRCRLSRAWASPGKRYRSGWLSLVSDIGWLEGGWSLGWLRMRAEDGPGWLWLIVSAQRSCAEPFEPFFLAAKLSFGCSLAAAFVACATATGLDLSMKHMRKLHEEAVYSVIYFARYVYKPCSGSNNSGALKHLASRATF